MKNLEKTTNKKYNFMNKDFPSTIVKKNGTFDSMCEDYKSNYFMKIEDKNNLVDKAIYSKLA